MNEYFIEKEENVLSGEGVQFFRQESKQGDIAAKAHIHSAIEMIYIGDGEYRVYSNEREYTAGKGDFLLFRSGTIHRIFAEGQSNHYYVVKMSPSLISDFSSKSAGSMYVMEFSVDRDGAKQHWSAEEAAACGIRDAMAHLVAESGKTGVGSDVAMRSATAALLLAVIRSIGETGGFAERSEVGADVINRIYRVITRIGENYAEDLSASMLAREVGMSYSYFSRCFSKVTGRSFKEYLNRVRVDRAEKELMTTDKSVTEISSDCGYNNVSYFISSYKKIKGKTPLSMRYGK